MNNPSKIFFTKKILSFLKEAKSQQHKLGFQKNYEYINLRDAMFNLLLVQEHPNDIDISRYNSTDTFHLKKLLAEGIANLVKNRVNLEPPNLKVSKKVYAIAKVLLSRKA